MCLECGTGSDKCLWTLVDDNSLAAQLIGKLMAEYLEKELK